MVLFGKEGGRGKFLVGPKHFPPGPPKTCLSKMERKHGGRSLMPNNVFSSMSHKMKSLTLCLDWWILERMEKFEKKIGEKMRKGVVW